MNMHQSCVPITESEIKTNNKRRSGERSETNDRARTKSTKTPEARGRS